MPLISPDQSVIYFFTYLNRGIMKAIFTFVTLFFILTAAIASCVLYLNESFNLSAVLYVIWIVSVTLWIKSAGVNIFNTKKHTTQNV
jgi:hypothetical protein